MPQRTSKRCRFKGCNQLTRDKSGYCEKHRKQTRQAKQQKYEHKSLYNYRWQQARKLFLAANPLCVKCKDNGLVATATIVDHISPHKGDEVLFWDENNWQALCSTCHNRKTATEDSNFAKGRGG